MQRLNEEQVALLQAREQRLLWPGPEVSPAELEMLLDDSFHEIGASGRRLERQFGLDTLNKRRLRVPAEEWLMTDLCGEQVTPDLVLFTYQLHRAGRATMRSTLWRRNHAGQWRAIFHQGTPLP